MLTPVKTARSQPSPSQCSWAEIDGTDHRGDVLARFHADAAEGVGPSQRRLVELAVGARPAADVPQERPVGVALGPAPDRPRQRLGGRERGLQAGRPARVVR